MLSDSGRTARSACRGMFDAEWVSTLQAATEAAMANPGKLATGTERR